MKTHRWTLITAGMLAVASIWPLAGCSTNGGGNAGSADQSGIVPSYQLTDSPVPVKTVQPEIPEELKNQTLSDQVLVAVIISPDSTVEKAWVTKGIDGQPKLDQAALDAVKQWRFKPGEVNQKPVKSETVIPVTFSPAMGDTTGQ